MHCFDPIFSPKSIAVIGALGAPGKPGSDILVNLSGGGYQGDIYAVGRKSNAQPGVKWISSVNDIPEETDLVVVDCSGTGVSSPFRDILKKDIKGILIPSSPTRSKENRKSDIENEIISMAEKARVRIIGPSCLGIINAHQKVRLNASLYPHIPSSGRISFICQNEALSAAVLDFAREKKIGFSKFVSLGSKSDVNEIDLLYYLHSDPQTKVILIYLEELQKGPAFIEAVRKITSDKNPTPVLAIKSGATSPEIIAVLSHAKALMGSVAIYDVVFQQAGVIPAGSIEELFDYASAFDQRNSRRKKIPEKKIPVGNRVAVITNTEGLGAMPLDLTVLSGLKPAKFKLRTIRFMNECLLAGTGFDNPISVGRNVSPVQYEKVFSEVIRDEGVDMVLLIYRPRSVSNSMETARTIVRVASNSSKPVFCCFMGVVDISSGVKYLHDHGISVFRFPENAIRALGALCKYSNWINRPQLAEFSFSHDKEKAGHFIENCLFSGKTILGELEGAALLECYGFKSLPGRMAKSEKEAVDIAEGIQYPVAMKIVSADILHKFDAGGVVLGLENRDHVRCAYKDIIEKARLYNPDAVIDGVLIQKMAPPGGEVILGMSRYPVFGPLVMFGLGGIFVEVFQDVIFRFAPVGRDEARRMIQGIKGCKIFKGFRGRPKSDMEILEKSIVSLSEMVMNHQEINELNINPLLVHDEGLGATVADCRIVLKPSHEFRK